MVLLVSLQSGHALSPPNNPAAARAVCWRADIDACADNGCTNGDGFAKCEDVSAAIGGLNNADGRTCTCRISADNGAALSGTQYYANDTAGCIGKCRDV
jgi:hypothetical protein